METFLEDRVEYNEFENEEFKNDSDDSDDYQEKLLVPSFNSVNQYNESVFSESSYSFFEYKLDGEEY